MATPPAAMLVLYLRQIVWHHAWGNPPMTNGCIVFLTVLVFLVCLRMITIHLKADLAPDRLSVTMKGLSRRTRIAVADIATAEAVEYDSRSRVYGGYGIRDGGWSAIQSLNLTFLVQHNAVAWSGGFRYRPATAVIFSRNFGSRDCLKVSVRLGLS